MAQVSKGWIEIELTEPTKLTGLELTAMTYSHSSYPDGFLKNFVVRAGLTANSEPHNTGGDNLLTDKPLMLTYDEASFNNPPTNTDWKILDSEVAYLTFDYPTEAQYVLIQADWDSASIFSIQEVKFLKGKNHRILLKGSNLMFSKLESLDVQTKAGSWTNHQAPHPRLE